MKAILFQFVFIIGYLIPTRAIGYYVLLLLLVCLLLVFRKPNSRPHIVSWVLVGIVVASLAHSLVAYDVSMKDLQKVLWPIVLLLLFPLCKPYEIKPITILALATITLVSQFVIIFHIEPFQSLLIQVFGPEDLTVFLYENVNVIEAQEVLSFRLGGLFYNPNQCGKFVTLLIFSFMMTRPRLASSKTMAIIAMCGVSIILTGSRSAFIVFILCVLVQAAGGWELIGERITILISGAVVLYVVYVLAFALTETELPRAISLTEGAFQRSLYSKFAIIGALYSILAQDEKLFEIVFGHCLATPEALQQNYPSVIGEYGFALDNGLGWLMFAYGGLGTVILIVIIVHIAMTERKKRSLLVIFMLHLASSTVFFHVKFCFLFFLTLSVNFPRFQIVRRARKQVHLRTAPKQLHDLVEEDHAAVQEKGSRAQETV